MPPAHTSRWRSVSWDRPAIAEWRRRRRLVIVKLGPHEILRDIHLFFIRKMRGLLLHYAIVHRGQHDVGFQHFQPDHSRRFRRGTTVTGQAILREELTAGMGFQVNRLAKASLKFVG